MYAQAIERIEGGPAAGDVVTVVDARGQFLGRGFYSPKSAIPVRILTRHQDDTIDAAFLGKAIEDAAKWRRELLRLPNNDTTGYRLIHSEGDGLGGLVVDIYGDTAAVQLLTLGMKVREADIFAEVQRVTGVKTVLEIASERTQRLEGFEVKTAVVRGPEITTLNFKELGFTHEVVFGEAQKTGYYFDQRDNRAMLETFAKGKRVLDAFCYTGAFALAAARGGASQVVAVDASAAAIASAAVAARHHQLDDKIELVRADVKKFLPEMAEKHDEFDIVIIDPPKLAPTARHVEQGRKAYRRLNSTAAKLVKKGGLLVTCSCSAAMRPGEFLRTVGIAARDSGRNVAMLHLGTQGADHPVPASFPEGRYLKCAFMRVT